MTITVHTNLIKKADYGDISFLGETMEEPLQRCMICNVQPEFYYDNQKQTFKIHHHCRVTNKNVEMTEYTYKELCDRWNKERGKNYGKDKTRTHGRKQKADS